MPSDAPFSAIPTAMPTITGSVVFVEMQQPVITSLTEDEIAEIISSAEDVFGVYPGNVVAEVTYDITGTFSLDANEDEVSDEEFFFRIPFQMFDTFWHLQENNKDVKLAALNINEARSLYRIERSDLLPTINANGSANIQRTSDESSLTGRSDDTETYAANVGLASYELDLFGRLRSQNEAALNEFFSTQVAEEVVQNALIAEVANAYLQLLADQDLLKLTEQTLKAQLDTYDLLSRTRDEGIATESDVSRAQTAVETARVNLHQYRRYVQQDKNALILLMGVAHDDALIPVSNINNITFEQSFFN